MKKKKGRGSKVSVTFEMAANGHDIQALAVAGDFNDWNPSATPLKRRKDGTWEATVSLAPGTYRYRFVAEGTRWYTDPTADRFEPSPYGEDNSVVVVEQM